MNLNFWIVVVVAMSLGFSIFSQGNDPDEEPSLQTEDGGIKKSSKSNEITKLKADSKKKSKKESNPVTDMSGEQVSKDKKTSKEKKSKKDKKDSKEKEVKKNTKKKKAD